MTKQTVESRSVESYWVESRPLIQRPFFDWNLDGPKAALLFFLFVPLLLSALLWPAQLNQTFSQPLSLGAEDLLGSCIEGTVTDEAATPIRTNWTILATPLDSSGTPKETEAITVLSDLNGRFRFRRPLLPAGTWQFMIILLDEWAPVSPQQIVLTLEDDQSGCRPINFTVRPAGQDPQTTQQANTPTVEPTATSTPVPTRQPAIVDPGGGGQLPTATNTLAPIFLPAPTKTSIVPQLPTLKASGSGTSIPIDPSPQNQPDDQQVPDDGRIEVSVLKIDDAHQPLAGWTIRAESAPDYVAADAIVVQTDQDGVALFRLLPGLWTFIEEAPDNITYEPIVPDTDRQQLVVKAPGPYMIRFKNRITGPGCIEVYKYDLPPGNGLPFGLEGWQIKVTRSDGSPVTGGKTNALGQIRFENLPFDSYTISEETRAGWSAVTADSLDIELSTLSCKLVTFFNKQTDETDQRPTPIPEETPDDSQKCTECHTGNYPKPKKPVYKPEKSGYGGKPGTGGSGCNKSHVVANGEWIYNIARAYGVSAQSLYNANPWVYQQYNHFLYPGQVLCIPRW